jgi:hypothetical protein
LDPGPLISKNSKKGNSGALQKLERHPKKEESKGLKKEERFKIFLALPQVVTNLAEDNERNHGNKGRIDNSIRIRVIQDRVEEKGERNVEQHPKD